MNNKKGGKFFDKQLHTTMPILQSTEHSPSWENLLANASIFSIMTLQHKVKPLPHALMAISMKGLLLASSFLPPVFATTTPQPIPYGALLSCQQAINRTTGWLVEKKAFIPFTTNTRPGRIQPRVVIENGNYAETYRTFPSHRPEKIIFYLSGDANQIWQGALGSPQTLTSFAAMMMASCPSVGLVEYRHWWEGYQPVGYFPDNTAKAFTWVDHNDPRRYTWGYYYST